MLAAIDVGNTSISIALFEGDVPVFKSGRPAKNPRTADDFARELEPMLLSAGIIPDQIDGVVLASVVPEITQVLCEGIRKALKCEPFIITTDTDTGISIQTDRPQELGVDRLIDAAAACHFYGGDLLVIDFGTATTYDLVTSSGGFLGGAISPGIRTIAEALSDRASKLPMIEVRKPASVLGTNTKDSMQSGVFYGYVGQIEYFTAAYRQILGDGMRVIATGGYAELFVDATKSIDIYDADLTIKGLKYIYEMHNKKYRK